MDIVSNTVRKTVPNYLSSLPIPRSVKGFSNLDCENLIEFSNFFLTFIYK